MTALTIRKIGNSEGVILPKEILAKLHVREGDQVFISDIPGGIAIQAYDSEMASDMALAEEIMRENRNALRKLAE